MASARIPYWVWVTVTQGVRILSQIYLFSLPLVSCPLGQCAAYWPSQTGLAVQAQFHESVFLFQSSAVFFFPEDQDEGKLKFFNKHDVKMVECFCMFRDQDVACVAVFSVSF